MQQSPAIARCQQIGALIQKLEDLYNQALKLDEETKNKLTGFREIRTGIQIGYGFEEIMKETTFQEEMDLTRIYLKRLGRVKGFTKDDIKLMDAAEIPDGLAWECMDEYLQDIINWLTTVLKK